MIAASIIMGAVVTRSPVAAIAIMVVFATLAVALTRPRLLFAIGILLIAVEPDRIFGAGSTAGRPETFKIVLYACIIPVVILRGLDRRKCGPLVAYGVVVILTELLGTRLPSLTTQQTVSSLATLCLGWFVFAINWNWQRDHWLLKVLAYVPLLSVFIGIALQAVGILSLFRVSSPPRLQGATITAWLAALSLWAALACLVLYRRGQWKHARWLGFVNVILLCATLTRGAVIALGIIAIPSLVRFSRRQLSLRGTNATAKLVLAVTIAVMAAVVVVPELIARGENATNYVPGRGAVHEIAAGRFAEWAFAYEQVKVNLLFGRGIGAGPLIVDLPGSPEGFTAQHNEYVRMLLEVGIIGGVILLITMVATLASFVRRAPFRVRADVAATGIAFAIYAITENTLSAAPLAMAFFLVFGMSGSPDPPKLKSGR